MTAVTIIVPTYNRPRWLEVSLKSILASAALVPVETRVLVVDDASPKRQANKVIAERLHVDYLLRPENSGYAPTVVAGLECVDSPYHAVFGDDDFMLPCWFPLHLAAIEKGYDVVSSSYWRADADLRPIRRKTFRSATLRDLRAGRNIVNDGSLVRRSALRNLHWKPEMESVMMLSMWLALAAAGRRFHAITEPTFLYRRHGGNLSSTHGVRNANQRRQVVAEYV